MADSEYGVSFSSQTPINGYDNYDYGYSSYEAPYSTPYSAPYSAPYSSPITFETESNFQTLMPVEVEEPRSWTSTVISAASSYVGQFTGLQNRAERLGSEAYSRIFDETIQNAANQVRKVPGLIVDAATNGMNAMLDTYKKIGVDPLDVYGPNIAKAYSYGYELSNSSSEVFRLPPEEIIRRVEKNVGPGDYIARIISTQYLNDIDSAMLSGHKQAWIAPLDEVLPYNLDSTALSTEFALSDSEGNQPQDLTLLIYQTDGETFIPATWEAISTRAAESSEFIEHLSADPELWNKLKEFDYAAHRERRAKFSSDADYYATLNSEQKNLYKARVLIEARFGANEKFNGKGYTEFREKAGVREYLTDNKYIKDMKNVGLMRLQERDGIPQASMDVPAVPDKLLISKELKEGALISALSGMGFEAYNMYARYSAGEISAEQAWNELPAALAKAGSGGAVTGVATEVLEKQFINSNILRTAEKNIVSSIAKKTGIKISGQFTRQIFGSSSAGALISGALSTFSEGYKYFNKETTASKALGNIAGQTATGAGSAAVGLGLTSYLASAGIVGGPVGVAAGIAAGVAADYAIRKLGLEETISHGVESAVDTISSTAEDAWNWVTDW